MKHNFTIIFQCHRDCESDFYKTENLSNRSHSDLKVSVRYRYSVPSSIVKYAHTHTQQGCSPEAFSAVFNTSVSNTPCRHAVKIPFPSYKSLTPASPLKMDKKGCRCSFRAALFGRFACCHVSIWPEVTGLFEKKWDWNPTISTGLGSCKSLVLLLNEIKLRSLAN